MILESQDWRADEKERCSPAVIVLARCVDRESQHIAEIPGKFLQDFQVFRTFWRAVFQHSLALRPPDCADTGRHSPRLIK